MTEHEGQVRRIFFSSSPRPDAGLAPLGSGGRSFFLSDEEEGLYRDALSTDCDLTESNSSFASSKKGDDDSSFCSEEFQDEREEEEDEKEDVLLVGTTTTFQQEKGNLLTRRNKAYALAAAGLALLVLLLVLPIAIAKRKETKTKSNEPNPMIPFPPSLQNNPTQPQATPVPVDDAPTNPGEASVPVSAPSPNSEAGASQEGGSSSRITAAPTTTISRGPLDDLFVPPEPQPSSLQGFSSEVLKPYTSREDLEQDLAAAANDMVQAILRQNVQTIQEFQAAFDADDNRPFTKESSSAQQKNRHNNRENDVHEGDVVQEDGTYVYAAYGDHLVVWNRFDGSRVAQEQMPPHTPADPWGWANTPSIASIQLTQDHVLVVVSGYGTTLDYSSPSSGSGREQPAITLADNETKVLVYTKPTDPTPFLTLVATQSLNGIPLACRYLTESNTVHIVTGVQVNTAGWLGDPLAFFHFLPTGMFQQINATDYYERANQLATQELIPTFVERLADELMENHHHPQSLPTVLQVNNWSTPHDRRLLSSVFGESYDGDQAIRSYVQVLTIDPQELPVDAFEESLKLNSTVILGPSADATVHAQADTIVLTMDRFDWDPRTETTDERLFLLQLKVRGGATRFSAATSLPGHLAGRYALDIQGDDLRVAVTHHGYFPLETIYKVCGQPPGALTALGQAEDSCSTEEGWIQCHDLVMAGCVNMAKTDCPYSYECEDDGYPGSSTENHVIVFGLSGDGEMPEKGRVQIGNDHDTIQTIHFGETFSYAITSQLGHDGPFYVLNMEEPSVTYTLQPSEMMGGIPATYLQPINEDGTLLVGIGQNSTGSSLFQTPLGVTVTVLDVFDPSAPQVIGSQTLKGDDFFSSPTSSAEWDAKGVQYTDNGMLIIPLSMYPSLDEIHDVFSDAIDSVFTSGNETTDFLSTPTLPSGFEGFVVLDLSNVVENGIQEVFRINHVGVEGKCNVCSNGGFLTNHRSIWYEDDNSLMTMYSHKAFSTDVATWTENWGLNISITEGGADDNCCF